MPLNFLLISVINCVSISSILDNLFFLFPYSFLGYSIISYFEYGAFFPPQCSNRASYEGMTICLYHLQRGMLSHVFGVPAPFPGILSLSHVFLVHSYLTSRKQLVLAFVLSDTMGPPLLSLCGYILFFLDALKERPLRENSESALRITCTEKMLVMDKI